MAGLSSANGREMQVGGGPSKQGLPSTSMLTVLLSVIAYLISFGYISEGSGVLCYRGYSFG